MRIDTLTGKDRARYDALVARGYGDVVSVTFNDVVEADVQVLVTPEVPATPDIPGAPAIIDEAGNTTLEAIEPIVGTTGSAAVYETKAGYDIVPVTRQYYVGSSTLGQVGKFIQIASVAFANGSSSKQMLGVGHNIPFVEAFTQAGVLSDALGTMLQEEDTAWLTENVSFDTAVDTILAFVSHNNFFEMVQKVMAAVGKIGTTLGGGIQITEESTRNALLGSLAAKS